MSVITDTHAAIHTALLVNAPGVPSEIVTATNITIIWAQHELGAPKGIAFTATADGAATLTTYTGPTGWDVALTVEADGTDGPFLRVILADRNDTDAAPIAELETTDRRAAGHALALWAVVAHNPEAVTTVLDVEDDPTWRTDPVDMVRVAREQWSGLAGLITHAAALAETFTCTACGDAEHRVIPTDEDSTWCECGSRLDEQRLARL